MAPAPSDLAERLPLGVVVFTGQDAVFANPAARRLLGPAAAAGSTPATIAASLGPGGLSLATLAAGAETVAVAGPRLLRVTCQECQDGLLWLVADVSTELRLLGQLAEHASALAHAHEAFLVVDGQGLVRYANEHAERERGHDSGGLVGASLADLERPCHASYQDARSQTAEEVRARFASLAGDAGTLRYHAWHRRRDGGELPVEVSVRAHRTSSETVFLLVARDDSRRLLHLQALLQAKGEAEQASRAKSAFLAITSHELRTPLTGIIGFCELLALELDAVQHPEAQRLLALIRESSHGLLTIINDILDLSKIEARSLELRPAAVDAEREMAAAVERWQPRAAAKGLTLAALPSTPRPGELRTDPLRLRQMLDNLIGNAIKFTANGRVEISAGGDATHCEFAVRDTGPGVPEAVREHLFTAFWQAADATTRSAGGNGLGLYITRQLAQLLGGRVWLAGCGPQGSEFRLRLPRSAPGSSGRIMKSGIWTPARP